jgi:nucleotide-binding universal stress UspA family protein
LVHQRSLIAIGPALQPLQTDPVIVVGVDGSESAREALRWALAEARLRNVPVRVVSAWHVAPLAYGAPGFAIADRELFDSFRVAAEQAMDETLDALADAAKGVQVEKSVIEGNAPHALVEAAHDAELLVVGSRGHGEVTGLLLGSVSFQVAHLAPCPVVIVRAHAG